MPALRQKVWTRGEFAAVASAGTLDAERFELIEGALIERMSKNRPHVTAMKFIALWLQRVFGAEFILTESTIDLAPEDNPTSEPEPDLIVLNRSYRDFKTENPRPADLALVIEVSDSTLAWDLGTKAPLYARAAIADFWVVDVVTRRIFIHRHPINGKYESILVYGENESVSPLAAPQAQLRISEIFA